MNVKPTGKLTLRDRLSRLDHATACRLLGGEGARLIREGGKIPVELDDGQVFVGEDLFRLGVDGGNVTITLHGEARKRLLFNCTQCESVPCEHIGAAVSVMLEEKMALGLAAAPEERRPVEALSETELIEQAMAGRLERAREEPMRMKSADPAQPWTDYQVTNKASGRTYRVALRGESPGDSYCDCPDFRKNTLGTCKHILHALEKVRKRFPKRKRSKPYRRESISVHLRYGERIELRLLLPDELGKAAREIVRPVADRPIDDLHDLLDRVRRLEGLGESVTIYPDAEEYIQQRLVLGHLEERAAEIRADPANHPLRRELLDAELLPYQLDGIGFAVGAGRAILADDMGLGKTIQGIGVAELLAREAGIERVLVICPASLKSQWRTEIRRFSGRDCQLVAGAAADRPAQYRNGTFFTICNYEQVLRDIRAIDRVDWDLVVLDEGQRIKNWEAKTSRTVKGLRSRFALVLSGTPLENRLDDLYSVVEFVDERRLGPGFRFFNRHRVVDEKGKVLGYKNLAELRERLAPILLRRTRASVMKELPPRSNEIVRIAPTGEQLDLHGSHMQVVSSILAKKYITEMDLLRLQKALLMCRMAADSTFLVDKQPPGHSTKLEALGDLLEQLAAEADRKMALFSEWTTMLDLIEPLAERHGLAHVRLDGSVPQQKRQALVHRFRDDADCRLFLATNAGSTGLNLQAANTVINVDLPWNPAVLEQRVARAHRMGQKRPVQVFLLVTEETIEERLLGTLSAKHELALAALDPEAEADEVSLQSGMEELKRRLEKLLGAKPEAPVVERDRRAAEKALARRESVAEAGGQLVGAAFNFLAEMLPAEGETEAESEASRELAEQIRAGLGECLEKDEAGRRKLTVTLPDAGALDPLADALARLLAGRAPGAGRGEKSVS